VHDTALWRTDGTEQGTSLVRDIDPRRFARIEAPTVIDGVALFVSRQRHRRRAVAKRRKRPTERNPLADIAPGLASSRPRLLGTTERQVFFAANDGQRGNELWALPRTALARHCIGDCDHDGGVTIDELVRGVTLALEGGTGCIAFDRNGDGATTIAELVGAVSAAQVGCE
jgi:hypothetical protein